MTELSTDQLHDLIERKQQQRLVIALEAHKVRQQKMLVQREKDAEKFQKLGDRLVTQLAKVEADLLKCEDILRDMTRLQHAVNLFDTELNQ